MQDGGDFDKPAAKKTLKRKQPDVKVEMLIDNEKGLKKLMSDMGELAQKGRFTGKRGNEV